jgi:hypothetical protein
LDWIAAWSTLSLTTLVGSMILHPLRKLNSRGERKGEPNSRFVSHAKRRVPSDVPKPKERFPRPMPRIDASEQALLTG